ncbi:alanine racemase [Subsaxibacter sp. CAU 1640]|uniref:alanine racemase n=1 Tax=Subsaxibacter sp. CAU 1640 TaxID=2933271 RepID=UPI0020034CFD|nr:alanine racemase [Subsaxibacter sp. CAU 1640]MCK7589425.1 alanine racemase [Subsaxibacter sp. CAU 1640]
MPKAQETVLEIDLNAVKHNLDYLKSKITSSTKFLAVVKAFAYGNDAEEIALYLQELNVDYFAVAYTSEGIHLRKAGVTKPILVLHPLPVSFKALIENCLEPNIYNHKVLSEFIEVATNEGQTNYPIHLKFNTGLNRLGFSISDLESIHSKIENTATVKIKSMFSHLAASEDLNERSFTLNQISTFKSIIENFESLFGFLPLIHMCNTSGILNYPEAHFDMVRSGIGLYGFGNSEEEDKNFKPIASLKSVISQIHHIEKGESVGYNRAFKSDAEQKTATIPIGHADGISRIYGNGKGYVIINGRKAPLVGNVCMDMIMVNVTGIDCEEGDEVIVFDADHTANDLAHNANTISYELITAVSQRVKRIVKK